MYNGQDRSAPGRYFLFGYVITIIIKGEYLYIWYGGIEIVIVRESR